MLFFLHVWRPICKCAYSSLVKRFSPSDVCTAAQAATFAHESSSHPRAICWCYSAAVSVEIAVDCLLRLRLRWYDSSTLFKSLLVTHVSLVGCASLQSLRAHLLGGIHWVCPTPAGVWEIARRSARGTLYKLIAVWVTAFFQRTFLQLILIATRSVKQKGHLCEGYFKIV